MIKKQPINPKAIERKPVDRDVTQIDIELIEVHDRMRPVDDEAVDALAASMESIGLRTPISVRHYPKRPHHLPASDTVDALVLIAGAHRLAAAARLGWERIECFVYYDGNDLDMQLWEIDENLTRLELSPSERASHTARRKAIYLELHPATKQGGAPGLPGGGKAKVDKLSTFAAETATATGKDERTVRRDAERGEKVIPEVLELINGTRLDTGTYLDKLKKLPPNEQLSAAKRDLAMDAKQAREEAKAEKAAKKAKRQAEQAEHDRQREEARNALPDAIKQQEEAKQKAIDASKVKAEAVPGPSDDGLSLEDRIAELEEAVRVLETENAELKAENKLYGGMKVQFAQGGFDKVIAGKDEEIRVLETRLYRESEDKASWMRSAKAGWAKAKELGWSRDVAIDIETGEIVDG